MTEDSFLANLFQRMPSFPSSVVVLPGDDCAAVELPDGNLQLLASDQLISDRHYFLDGETPTDPKDAGRKLLARNLSDIAAMGGSAEYCLMTISTPKELTMTWLDDFFDGLLALSKEYQVPLIGGDLATASGGCFASLTITGKVAKADICLRSGAKIDDKLYATGCFGNSLSTGHHLHFIPRLAEGKWLAENRIATAMIDVSDGLLLDALRISQMSAVGIMLNCSKIKLRTPQTTIQQALTDGEDYELLFAVSADREKFLLDNWLFDTPLTCLGACQDLSLGDVVSENGVVLSNLKSRGFDHF